MRIGALAIMALATSGGLLLVAGLGCGERGQATVTEVVAVRRAALPSDLDDPVWRTAPVHPAPLIVQDMVEPRLMNPSTAEVRVQAVSDGDRIAFRLAWIDSTRDDLPGASRFSDACAVQLPAESRPDLPAPQMGEKGRRVEIAYWNAAWQAVADGRPDETEALYPNAAVDHYPFMAPSIDPASPEGRAMATRYAPARAAGNQMARPASGSPVEDLVAEGPGTLTRASGEMPSSGTGRRGKQGWEVMVARPLPASASVAGAARLHVAFAVWDGGRSEVGARKMRSVWIPITLESGK